MEKKQNEKKPTRLVLTLYGVCAVIWILRVIRMARLHDFDSPVYFAANVLVAAVWTAAFFKWLRV